MQDANRRIKEALKQRGITRREVAEHVGVKLGTVNSWLSEGRPIPMPKLRAIESLIAAGNQRPAQFDDVVAFAVRMTPEEYRLLCRAAGVESLDPAAAERQVRAMLQETWNCLAREAPQVVGQAELEERYLTAAEPDSPEDV